MARADLDAANINQLDVRGDRIIYLTQPLDIDGTLESGRNRRYVSMISKHANPRWSQRMWTCLVARWAARIDQA